VSDPAPLPFGARLWFAFACFFRVLFDAAFAGRAFAVRDAMPALPPPKAEPRPEPPPKVEPKPEPKVPPKPEPKAIELPAPPPTTSALQLLGLLQREGRLVDFLEQDVASFSDADVGVAARVVHEGCRKALRDHVTIAPVRGEDEGAKVTLEAGFDATAAKLVGNVSGKGPYKGTLVHRGWKATKIELPTPVAGHDPAILAPAEVEL
jgi:hypothetical protein